MGFFEELYSVTGVEFPGPEGLGTPQKAALARRMRNMGHSVAEIAEHFNVSVQRIYQILKLAADQEISEIENHTFLDSLITQIMSLQDTIDYYKKIQQGIRCKYKEDEDDSDTTPDGKKKKGSIRDFVEVGRLISNYEKMKIDLMKVGGLLPVINDHTSLHSSIADKKPQEEEDHTNLNDEKITEMLLQKMAKTPVGLKKTLKDVKDDKIL